jgi:hypothetical protein
MLVGEANPYGSDECFALYPSPRGCAGERLCHLVLGLDEESYLAGFDRQNLCPRQWKPREAHVRAEQMRLSGPDRTFILLGAKVTRAFGLEWSPFTWMNGEARFFRPKHSFVILPHPSGLSRSWGVPGAYERARQTLREAGVLPLVVTTM